METKNEQIENVVSEYESNDIIEDLPKDVLNIMSIKDLQNFLDDTIEDGDELEYDVDSNNINTLRNEALSYMNDHGLTKPNEQAEVLMVYISNQKINSLLNNL